MPDWFTLPEKQHVSKLKCFFTDFMEPYVLLRYSSSTPLFAEQFVNYGYNKVQLVEHLRAANFKFFILHNAFAMDMPHPKYVFHFPYSFPISISISFYFFLFPHLLVQSLKVNIAILFLH